MSYSPTSSSKSKPVSCHQGPKSGPHWLRGNPRVLLCLWEQLCPNSCLLRRAPRVTPKSWKSQGSSPGWFGILPCKKSGLTHNLSGQGGEKERERQRDSSYVHVRASTPERELGGTSAQHTHIPMQLPTYCSSVAHKIQETLQGIKGLNFALLASILP